MVDMDKNELNTYFKKDSIRKRIYRDMLKNDLKERYLVLIMEEGLDMTLTEFLDWCIEKAEYAEDYETAQAIKDIIDESIGLD